MVGPTFATSVKPTDWGNGWEAGYSESFQQSLVDQCSAIYASFIGAIRGTWHDNGGLTAVKSLYFDGGAWLLNGCNYSAQFVVPTEIFRHHRHRRQICVGYVNVAKDILLPHRVMRE